MCVSEIHHHCAEAVKTGAAHQQRCDEGFHTGVGVAWWMAVRVSAGGDHPSSHHHHNHHDVGVVWLIEMDCAEGCGLLVNDHHSCCRYVCHSRADHLHRDAALLLLMDVSSCAEIGHHLLHVIGCVLQTFHEVAASDVLLRIRV